MQSDEDEEDYNEDEDEAGTADDFEEFAEGAEEDDFGDFDDGFEEPAESQAGTAQQAQPSGPPPFVSSHHLTPKTVYEVFPLTSPWLAYP